MLNIFKRRLIEAVDCDPINQRVRWVAEEFNNLPLFRERAEFAAKELGLGSVDHLGSLFHTENVPPAYLSKQFSGLGQWMAARQFAIFEILYHFGEHSLPVLSRVAFGEYDWTQGNAVEVLCRIASNGIKTKEIVAELKKYLPSMREEAHFYAVGPLIIQAKSNPALTSIIEQLLDVSEFKESYMRMCEVGNV